MGANRQPPSPLPLPPAAGFQGTFSKSFSTLSRTSGGPVQIVVNGDVVLPGDQGARAMALCGIDEAELDRVWEATVARTYTPTITGVGAGEIDRFAYDNQAGAGWRVEVRVAGGTGVQTVPDLAYVDQRDVQREFAFLYRRYEPLTYAEYAERGFDGSIDRFSWVDDRLRQAPEAAGAMAAWFSGVDDAEVEATRRAAWALEAARRDLELALDEIRYAIRVADAAWSGDRADAAKGKFILEHDIVEAIAGAVHHWEDFTQDLTRFQRRAQQEDRTLVDQVLAEFGILVVFGILTGGVGSAVRAGAFATRIAEWGRALEVFKFVLRDLNHTRAARAVELATHVRSLRILARGAGDLTAVTAIRAVQDRPVTFTDVVISFGLAGFWGQRTSEWASRFGVTFGATARGATRGAAQSVPRSAASGTFAAVSATDASLGRLATGYGVGVTSEALKETVRAQLRATLLAEARQDTAQVVAARSTVLDGIAATHGRSSDEYARVVSNPAALDDLVNAELVRQIDAGLNPVLDYAFTGAGRAAAETINTTTQGSQAGAPDLRTNADGLVVQPARTEPVAPVTGAAGN